MERKVPRFGKGQGLQVIHQPAQQPGLVQGVIDVFGRGHVHTIDDAFQVALNNVERCAKLMRDVGGEIAALLFGAFELAHHVVEAFE